MYPTSSDPLMRIVLMAAALAVAGCAVTPREPVPVEDRGPMPRSVPPASSSAPPAPREAPVEDRGPGPEARAGRPAPAKVSATPAVVALLDDARRAERRGDLELSEASLERAIRIEPRNPWLWHRLALVKLFRREHGEAVAMAQRSNALAAGRGDLQRENWRLIAQAEEARGRTAAAERAAARAARLEP